MITKKTSTLVKGKLFSINKKGRINQKGVPLSSNLQNQVKELHRIILFQKLGEDYTSVRVQFHKSLSSIINLASKKLNHI